MPLMRGRSKAAFEHNVKVEMHAGTPQKQALAIAYAMQRGGGKRKKTEKGEHNDEHDYRD